MKIKPIGKLLQLEIEDIKVGALDTSSRDSAVEYAKVVAIGDGFSPLQKEDLPKVGDYVFVKAWAIDIINYENKKYYFVNIDTNGILAVVK